MRNRPLVRFVLCTVLALSGIGCDEEVEPEPSDASVTSNRRERANGTITVVPSSDGYLCSDSDRSSIEAAWRQISEVLLRSKQSNYLTCMRNSFGSQYDMASGTSTETENAFAILTADRTLTVSCERPTLNPFADAGHWPIVWGDPSRLVPEAIVVTAASSATVEVLRNAMVATLFARWNIPSYPADEQVTPRVIARGCFDWAVDAPSHIPPVPPRFPIGAPARSDLAHGAYLEPAGLTTGTLVETVECDVSNARGDGGFATGLIGQESSRIHGIGLSCRQVPEDASGNTLPETSTSGRFASYVSGGSATTFERSCGVDRLLVGVELRHDYLSVGTIRPVCDLRSNIVSRSDSGIGGEWVGELGGPIFRRYCPAGMAVRAIRTRSVTGPQYLTSVELLCHTVGDETKMTIAGSSASAGYTRGVAITNRAAPQCPPGTALSGFEGTATASLVNRIVPVCGGIANPNTPNIDDGPEVARLQGMGVQGGTAFSRTCGSGRIIGMSVGYTGGVVSSIEVRCADPLSWRAGAGGFYLRKIGRFADIRQTQHWCPAGSFVTSILASGNSTALTGVSFTCEPFTY